MANGYVYYWDRSAKKKVYGGKYQGPNIEARGYYGTNTAGVAHEFDPNSAGVKREFIGSGTKEFVFYSATRGILTVRADSYEEAWQIAKSRGYSKRRYKR